MYPLKLKHPHFIKNRQGYIHLDNLDFMRNPEKRLDEHRETMQDLMNRTVIYLKFPWVFGAMSDIDALFQHVLNMRYKHDAHILDLIYTHHIRPIVQASVPETIQNPYNPDAPLQALLDRMQARKIPLVEIAENEQLYKGDFIQRTKIADPVSIIRHLNHHREVTELVKLNSDLFIEDPWVYQHMSTTDYYLQWLFFLITDMTVYNYQAKCAIFALKESVFSGVTMAKIETLFYEFRKKEIT